MKIKSVLIVGAGGIGSNLFEALSLLLSYHPNGTPTIRIADGDIFEEKNLARQLFPAEYVGENKARVLARKMWDRIPSISYFDKYINNDNIHEVFNYLPGPLLVIMCVDNDATRRLLLDHLADKQNYHWISAGNGLSAVSCHYYTPGGKYAHPLERYMNLREPADRIPGGCGEIVQSHPQIIGANFMAASAILSMVTTLLDGKPVPSDVTGEVYLSTIGNGNGSFYLDKVLSKLNSAVTS